MHAGQCSECMHAKGGKVHICMQNCYVQIFCSILESLSGPKLTRVSTCHARIALAHVQAHTYEAEDAKVPMPEDHDDCMLEALAGTSNNEEQYVVLCGLVRHMLHPQIRCRATIKQALESQLFADC